MASVFLFYQCTDISVSCYLYIGLVFWNQPPLGFRTSGLNMPPYTSKIPSRCGSPSPSRIYSNFGYTKRSWHRARGRQTQGWCYLRRLMQSLPATWYWDSGSMPFWRPIGRWFVRIEVDPIPRELPHAPSRYQRKVFSADDKRLKSSLTNWRSGPRCALHPMYRPKLLLFAIQLARNAENSSTNSPGFVLIGHTLGVSSPQTFWFYHQEVGRSILVRMTSI